MRSTRPACTCDQREDAFEDLMRRRNQAQAKLEPSRRPRQRPRPPSLLQRSARIRRLARHCRTAVRVRSADVLIVRPLLRTTSRPRTQAQPLPDLPSDHSLKHDGAPCRPRWRTLNRLVDDQRAAQNDGLKRRIVGRGALEVTGVLRRRAEPGAEHRRHAQNDAEHTADGFTAPTTEPALGAGNALLVAPSDLRPGRRL